MSGAEAVKPGYLHWLTLPEDVPIEVLREEAASLYPFKLHIRVKIGPISLTHDGSLRCPVTTVDDASVSHVPIFFPQPGYVTYVAYFIPTDECAANEN